MAEKKSNWQKPKLIVLSRETTEEVSLVTCKNAIQVVGPGGKPGKTGCKSLGCGKLDAPS